MLIQPDGEERSDDARQTHHPFYRTAGRMRRSARLMLLSAGFAMAIIAAIWLLRMSYVLTD